MPTRLSLTPLLLTMTMVVVYSISRDPALSAVATLLLAPVLVVASGALMTLASRTTRGEVQRTSVSGHHDPRGARHFIPCAFCSAPDQCEQRRN